MHMHTITRTLLVAVALASTGCYHITTKVPGVLDLRSDGSGASVDNKASAATRSGFDGIMNGDGVSGSGDLTIQDRKYWVCGLLPVLNESATEEITTGMGTGGAMRNVRIGEQYTILNWFMTVCVSAIPVVNIAGLVMPPRDFNFWGTRIKPEGAAPPADGLPPPAAEGAPPPPDAATPPAAPGAY